LIGHDFLSSSYFLNTSLALILDASHETVYGKCQQGDYHCLGRRGQTK
jgi:hypothetical protein